MLEILTDPYLWLILALIFNVGHMFFHVAFFRGYDGKYSNIYDGVVGYFGALCIIMLVYTNRGTVQFPRSIALPIGFILFILGIIIHFKAQLDFNKYIKIMTLVDKGIYRYIKHPMYLGGSISFIGISIGARSYLGLATVWIWILLIAICGYLEEIKLRNDLPKDKYDEYSKNTWI